MLAVIFHFVIGISGILLFLYGLVGLTYPFLDLRMAIVFMGWGVVLRVLAQSIILEE